MTPSRIHMRILLPSRLFLDERQVSSMVAQTAKGSWGFLPNRLDCVVPIEPGILTYRIEEDEPKFIGVDQGVLLKTGLQVTISVRHAIGGVDLGMLRRAVEEEFLAADEREREVRNTLARLEGGFIRRYMELRDE